MGCDEGIGFGLCFDDGLDFVGFAVHDDGKFVALV